LRLAAAGLLLGLSACASRTWNAPISATDPAKDYVFANRLPQDNSQDLFVVLAFSGGGIRSAAFSYAILEELRDTMIVVGGRKRSLLDEIDVISSVSGGSYTAGYYGLFGDRIFRDFETDFLKRDIEGDLIGYILRPDNLLRLVGPDFNRSDIIAEWFADELFEKRTFKDMSLGHLPFIIINASDINTGTTFSFIQQQFDFLCSDISSYSVANAVTASSAAPGPFASIGVRNFREDCAQRRKTWVHDAIRGGNRRSHEYQMARALVRYLDPKSMPVIRLVDGGVTDNLGVRGSMMSPVAHYGNVMAMSGAFTPAALERVKDVLVILANAETYPEFDWSRSGDEPGLVSMLSASFDAAVGLLNSETMPLAENGFRMWTTYVNRLKNRKDRPLNLHFTTLTLDQIEDKAEKAYFNSIPTTLSLSVEQIDRVRCISRRLLRASPAFRKFISRFSASGRKTGDAKASSCVKPDGDGVVSRLRQ
jgi:NTE family protein